MTIGWGLDEEYVEPEESDFDSVKPVKRVVATNCDGGGKRGLWGISCLDDLDDLMDE